MTIKYVPIDMDEDTQKISHWIDCEPVAVAVSDSQINRILLLMELVAIKDYNNNNTMIFINRSSDDPPSRALAHPSEIHRLIQWVSG